MLCCAAESAACMACQGLSCCANTCSKGSEAAAKGIYLFFMVISFVLSMMLKYFGSSLVYNLPFNFGKIGCVGNITASSTAGNSWIPTPEIDLKSYQLDCMGNAAVYRISMALALWFLISLIVCMCMPSFHRGNWCIKGLLWFVMIVGSFFAPNHVFDNSGYAWFSRVVSALFLILQIAMLIDWAYTWNDSWVERSNAAEDESGEKYWLNLILGFCGFFYVIFLTGCLFLFIEFSCDMALGFTLFTLIAGITVTAVQLKSGDNGGGNLLTSAIVCMYAMYLCYSAISSNTACSGASALSTGDNITDTMISVLIAALSLTWTVYSASTSINSYAEVPTTDTVNTPLNGANRSTVGGSFVEEDGVVPAAGRGAEKEGEDAFENASEQEIVQAEQSGGRKAYVIFHLVMATGSVYMAMLLTDWGSGASITSTATTPTANYGLGEASMWVKIVSQWFTFLLYLWTVLAPVWFPDREF